MERPVDIAQVVLYGSCRTFQSLSYGEVPWEYPGGGERSRCGSFESYSTMRFSSANALAWGAPFGTCCSGYTSHCEGALQFHLRRNPKDSEGLPSNAPHVSQGLPQGWFYKTAAIVPPRQRLLLWLDLGCHSDNQ